jgi:transposase
MEGWMLSKEDFLVIQALRRRGVYLVDIAADLGVSPKSVQRALRRGGPPSGKRRRRGSKLDAYKPKVDGLLQENVWNAQVILREIQALGYGGGITVLREYIQPKRELKASRATVRFETAPGKQLQSDWGEIWTDIDGKRVKVHFCVNTLGFSRRFHVWAAPCEDAAHTYEALIQSFEYFRGVCEEVLFDNQGPVVLAHRPPDRPRFHPRVVDLAGHYGFTPKACRPYRARTKGKTERMVGYVKHHFFVRYRRFESWAHLQQQLEHWLREEADQRLHGTVKEIVAERFTRERDQLQALPATRWDTSYHEQRQVSWDGYVDVRGDRYAVPGELCGKRVGVRISLAGELSIYHDDALVIRYGLGPSTGRWIGTAGVHASLWESIRAEPVETRPLSVYEEVAACSSTAC